MHDGNRLRNYSIGLVAGILLAIGVGYPLWVSSSKLDQAILVQANSASKEAERRNVAARQKCSTISASNEKRECIAKVAKSYRETERDERDLEAQRVMANWTRVMGKAAIIGMGVGIVGLFLIFVTFWETRKAADAGREANQIAKEQQRARIVASAKSMQIIAHQEALILGCENIGASAALRLRCSQEVFDKPPVNPTKIGNTGEYRTVKAGAESQLCVMGMEAITKFIAGMIEYDTTSEKGCKTYFCFRFTKSNISDDYYSIECVPDTWPTDT